MSQPDFKTILRQVRERVAEGEPLGSILADYPDYADELRVLLRDEQYRMRDLLQEKPAKPKLKPQPVNRSSRRALAYGGALLAMFLVVAGALGFFAIQERVIIDYEPLPPSYPSFAQTYANDACASLAYEPRPIVQEQQITSSQNSAVVDETYGEDDSVGAVEVEEEPREVAASPLPTSEALPGSDASTTDYDGAEAEVAPVGGIAAEGALPDTGGGGAYDGDTAVGYPAGDAIVPTSVASFDERPAESRTESDREMAATSAELAVQQPLQPLQAGEIDDNADWDTYQEYRNNYLQQYGMFTVTDLDTTDRQVIRVVDDNNLPVLGACVQIFHGERLITESFTYATGLTMFFPNVREDTRYVDEFTVRATYGQIVAESNLDRTDIGGAVTVELPIEHNSTNPKLDVMFLIDSTGSMADEILQLQENILAISTQIDALPGNVDVRYGLVTYRDRTDEYVTRVYDFTDDVRQFQANLNTVEAGGGGDYPESLNQGLEESLNVVSWRGSDTVKLVFLVADAPPQLNYRDDVNYTISMHEALERGIKIHPIASSGLQPEGEYILRQIGQYTMGHFIFLTYEDGTPGTPGEERPDLQVGSPEDEQGIGDYSVAELDELVLRLITDELTALNGQ
ncbi:MAG: VWA domain-containing protein, partial [Anaerolineae bacterium]|nr:VWA domain-containing protein [Anaerolineae bacterium]